MSHEATGIYYASRQCRDVLAAHSARAAERARAADRRAHESGWEDAETKARLTAFEQVLQQLGWTIGQNVRIDDRAAGGNTDKLRSYAAELVALVPDVILAQSSTAVALLLQATHSVPIVFVTSSIRSAPASSISLARPGGNATGFMLFEYSLSGKWLELLKEIAPRDTSGCPSRSRHIRRDGQFGAIQAMAPSLGVEVSPVSVRDAGEIERAVEAFARTANGGLIVTASASVSFIVT